MLLKNDTRVVLSFMRLKIHVFCFDTFCRFLSKYRRFIVMDDLVELLDPEDEGTTILRNVDKCLPVNTA
jgi:hypothetical protein